MRFWNVVTRLDIGGIAQVIREMNKCNLPIIGFAEGSLAGKWEQRLNSGETII